ncbi:HTH-like domain-containing protein [Rhodopseudomonas parapalustris]
MADESASPKTCSTRSPTAASWKSGRSSTKPPSQRSSREPIAAVGRVSRRRNPPSECTACFGVMADYASLIRPTGCKDIAVLAGIPHSYATEIRKGMKLAPYVSMRSTGRV